MRHLVKGRKLGRSTPHRKATLQALANALIEHKRIKTTLPKAKELRRFVEPLITKSKTDNTHNRRQVFSALQSKESAKIMFDEIGKAVADRPGGYTRILKLGFRAGDGTEEAFIEIVDFSDYSPEKKSGAKAKTRRGGKRRSKGGSKPSEEAVSAAVPAAETEVASEAETISPDEVSEASEATTSAGSEILETEGVVEEEQTAEESTADEASDEVEEITAKESETSEAEDESSDEEKK